MKAIIVQAGGGYYGFNVRLVADDVAARVETQLQTKGTRQEDGSYIVDNVAEGESAMVMIQDADNGQSLGYDSGMWNAAEDLIVELTS